MKTASLKLAAGLGLSLLTLSQNGMAETKPVYRNMNMPILSCQISEESKKSAEAAGITPAPKLDVVADFEAAIMLSQGMISKSQAMVVFSYDQADAVTGSTLNSILTGTLSKNSKAKWTFASEEIRYNEKYVNYQTVVISTKDKTAKVSLLKVGEKSSNDFAIYNCKSGLLE